MQYKHTQIGYLIIWILVAVTILFWIILGQAGYEMYITIIMGLIMFILVSFTTLTVTVDSQTVRLMFGYGIYRTSFSISEIVSAKAVRNKWYYGWGIKLWFWPYMVIFNVSGFDAVEIRMKDGKIYRIGTDEPKKLEHAIGSVIKS